ncbi:MAG: DUF4982 domain-containing protein [Oscillospiraceae bacterium]|nr:DUF4982 domain-containing protein [Oscillospiraceae bacterium]
MKKYRMDNGWFFHEGELETNSDRGHTYTYMASKAGGHPESSADFGAEGWVKVDLPHDFAVGHEFDEKEGPARGYKNRGRAWYARRFHLDKKDEGKQVLVEFGGVATHAEVFCNGSAVGRNFCGYTSFVCDISDMAVFGENVNTLVVHVDADSIEGWWYEGAGIYRHVDLYIKDKIHIAHGGVFVNPRKVSDNIWDTRIEVEVENSSYNGKSVEVEAYIVNESGAEVSSKVNRFVKVASGSRALANLNIEMHLPKLWDIDSPNLYKLICAVYDNGKSVDRTETVFGYRTIEISENDGFFLNGRKVTLYGTCNHQDHAGVGVAVPDYVNEYRIQLLKEMGTNAYRCAHGNPDSYVLDMCDKYGLLVMDENRNFNSSPDGIRDVRSMVKRDRNHPSVIMYSLFNEEPHQGTKTGYKIASRLACEVRKLDNTRFLTGAMNTGFFEKDGCGELLDVTGFNYNTQILDEFREKYPYQPMIGSENNSAFQTRGVYKTDNDKHIIDCYDTEAAPWGNTHRDGFRQINERGYMIGLFIWTGFDYRGEPTPYKWPSIGTQFGIMDTCGFKKDAFYLNKAYFTDKPMIHILPHWTHDVPEGTPIKVMTHTNCEEAELFLNGKSLGRKSVDRYDMQEWEVPYEKGALLMYGYKNGEKAAAAEVRTAEEPAKIIVKPARNYVYDSGRDTAIVNIWTTDKNGVIVPCADNLMKISAEGAKIIGVGNGDPNSHESDKAEQRHLFNGYAQAVIEHTGAKEIRVTVRSDGLETGEAVIGVRESADKIRWLGEVSEIYVTTWRSKLELSEDMPDPGEKIADHDMNTWGVYTSGSGDDPRYDGKTGYGLYKTTVTLDKKGSHEIVFNELKGNKGYVYINGECVFEGDCRWGRQIKIPLDAEVSGDMAIDVVIHSSEKDDNGGISKSVVIIRK